MLQLDLFTSNTKLQFVKLLQTHITSSNYKQASPTPEWVRLPTQKWHMHIFLMNTERSSLIRWKLLDSVLTISINYFHGYAKLLTGLWSLTSQTWHHDSIQIFKQHGESIYGLDVILPFMRSKSSAAPRKSSPSGVALKVCTTVLNLLKPRCTNCCGHPLPWGLSLVTSYGGCQIRVRPLFKVDSLLKKILCCQ